jgi:hypothetical protein
MGTTPNTLLLLSLAGFIATCGPQTQPRTKTIVKPTPLPESSVAGTVAYRPTPSTFIKLPRFRVALTRGSDTVQTVTTTDTGTYRFRRVTPGDYKVCWGGERWVSGCSEPFAVTAGDSASLELIEPRPAGAGTMKWGQVLLADGSAIEATPETRVDLLDAAGRVVASAPLNADSEYVLPSGGGDELLFTYDKTALEVAVSSTAAGRSGANDLRIADHPPSIASIKAYRDGSAIVRANGGETITLRPTLIDPDKDSIAYEWSVAAAGGTITAASDGTAIWRLPPNPALRSAYLVVRDGKGGVARGSIALAVSAPGGPPAATATCPTTGCQPLPLTTVPPPAEDSPGVPSFLTRMLEATDQSSIYYDTVDKVKKRRTLGDWWEQAGFDKTDGSGGTDGTGKPTDVSYLNFNDLGFGRSMHFNRRGDDIYAWVTNYGCPNNEPCNADLAASPDPATAIATVCMEYAAVEGETTRIVKFFVYDGGLPAGALVGQADLDGHGPKPVPNLCQNCHGGPTPYDGTTYNLNANFIPFDLATLQYSPHGTATPPPADLTVYRTLNDLVVATQPSKAIKDLVAGWYKSSATIQDNNYVPSGWPQTGAPADLYRTVIAPSCRSCHYSLSDDASWDEYTKTLARRGIIRKRVCAKNPIMPHAAITYINFWTNAHGFATNPPDFLASYEDLTVTPPWSAFGTCTGR